MPPISEAASPSEETVTSRRVPRPEKGGKSAVTITAATLRVRRLAPRTLTPMRSIIDCSDCPVKGAFCKVSPVPCRPTTRP